MPTGAFGHTHARLHPADIQESKDCSSYHCNNEHNKTGSRIWAREARTKIHTRTHTHIHTQTQTHALVKGRNITKTVFNNVFLHIIYNLTFFAG